jgi:hypothetical protein
MICCETTDLLKHYLFIFPEINECESSPCQNRAECVDKVDSYICTCKDGYEGINCEIGKCLLIMQ